MALRTRKEEREAVRALLESEEFDSAEALAEEILKTSFSLLQGRELYVIGVDVGGVQLAYGVFSTPAEAGKYAKTVGGPSLGYRKIYPIGKLMEKLEHLDNPLRATCETCNHFQDIHNNTGAKPGCPVKNCTCPVRSF